MTQTHNESTPEPETLRDRATHAYESAVARAGDAVDTSREKAHEAADQASEVIEGNPLGILVGGLALGAVVGALVPRGEREKQLLAPVGKRIGVAAVAALAAAKDVGRSELDELGLSKDAAREQVKSLFQGVAKAAAHAGTAAAQSAREQIKTPQ
jgi:ElaB/YqjD/DUF883 family membrane-anchored ribosome-binding protein